MLRFSKIVKHSGWSVVTFRCDEKRRVNVSWPVRERRRTRRSPRPTGARIDLKIKVVAIII